jgi:hypothetical protein
MSADQDASAMALAVLRAADFDWTLQLRSVWRDMPTHVPALHEPVLRRMVEDFILGTRPEAAQNPLGKVIVGSAGAGKTHLLGALRARVWEEGGFFVLLDLLDVRDFWESAVVGLLDALAQPVPEGGDQGARLLKRLEAGPGVPKELKAALAKPRPEGFGGAIRRLFGARSAAEGLKHGDVLRALVWLQRGDPEQRQLARAWLLGVDLPESRQTLHLIAPSSSPRATVEGVSWAMSLAGPTLWAVDQIDAIVSITHAQAGQGSTEDAAERRARAIIDSLALGLMWLWDGTRRSMTVVSTLEETWEVLRQRVTAPMLGRFAQPTGLRPIGDAEVARRLVEARLAAAGREFGWTPPYPSWPFRPETFAGTAMLSPRELLRRCAEHVERCRMQGSVSELPSFIEAPPAIPSPHPPPPGEDTVEQRYRALVAAGSGVDGQQEDLAVSLLRAALEALRRQGGTAGSAGMTCDFGVANLDARLTLGDAAAPLRQRHIAFRIVQQSNAVAVQARLRAAINTAGIDRDLPFRQLVIIRRAPWPSGSRTAQLVQDFETRGGLRLAFEEDDLCRFSALRALLHERTPGLDDWLLRRQPLMDSPFFQALRLVGPAVSADPPTGPAAPSGNDGGTTGAPAPTEPRAVGSAARSSVGAPSAPGAASVIPLGVRIGDGRAIELRLDLLPRHLAIVAGAGSGKTVLLRRLVEEAALLGIPAILLDSNNDLVTLADAWPEQPAGFTATDRAKAARLREAAEVVIWTPGRSRGNPISLAPLPDFAALGEDAEDRAAAVEVAATALGSLLPPSGRGGQLAQGVLRDTLRHFAGQGGGRLDDLIALLRDLPAEVSRIDRADRHAGDIANALLAARSINPLLDGEGTPLDTAILLRSAAGRPRISVVNLAGLPNDEARQAFAGRLMMALFGHIRRHPARAGQPVAALLVIDEAHNFAPAVRMTPSKQATIALARQARKYGLGLLLATQEPRAIDNAIIGNCTTQLYGRISSPAALETVTALLASRGGGGGDLGRLERGEFYVTTEGMPRAEKLKAPLCLTHHPQNPPGEDEVVQRAATYRVPA